MAPQHLSRGRFTWASSWELVPFWWLAVPLPLVIFVLFAHDNCCSAFVCANTVVACDALGPVASGG